MSVKFRVFIQRYLFIIVFLIGNVFSKGINFLVSCFFTESDWIMPFGIDMIIRIFMAICIYFVVYLTLSLWVDRESTEKETLFLRNVCSIIIMIGSVIGIFAHFQILI